MHQSRTPIYPYTYKDGMLDHVLALQQDGILYVKGCGGECLFSGFQGDNRVIFREKCDMYLQFHRKIF